MKANFHLHTNEDKVKKGLLPKYSIYEALDEAKKQDFNVLAVTCHDFVANDPKYYDYAQKLGILLIPGIEKTIEKKHVLIINATKEAENLETFADLRQYKKEHPEIFVIAPHPFHFTPYCLGKDLYKHIDIFDALEWSWFYFKFFNPNKKSARVARQFHLPIIATSDTHNLALLNQSYITAEIANLNFSHIKEVLKSGKFQNHTTPPNIFNLNTWSWISWVSKLQEKLQRK